MKPGSTWTDLAYFDAIARLGSLARAAQALGVSQATLSRRMRAYEAQLGKRLFVHGTDGYALTPDGIELHLKTAAMAEIARQIDAWQDGTMPVSVRISAGTWTATDLAQNVTAFWQPTAGWTPDFVTCDTDLDIARRQVDIGIRNRQPEQPWIARRQIGWVDYAIYGTDASVAGWIGPSQDAATTPSARWIIEHHGPQIVARANMPMLAARLALAGIGRVVLPTFIAAHWPGLVALSDPIPELRSAQWLASHHDARDTPAIRAALDAIGAYLERRGQPTRQHDQRR